jgi:hypothetical protein
MSDKKTVAGLIQKENDDGFMEKYVVSNAPLIVAVFCNIVVIISDYRAYDVVFNLTGEVWKALSASLACAIPFLMWEISWQYNHTTNAWRTVSLVMAGIAFATSIVLGVTDFIATPDSDVVVANWLLGGVVIVTGIHTVMGFLYFYNDPDVARKRRKSQSMAAMMDQEQNAEVAENLLNSGNALLGMIAQMEQKYSPEEVEAVLRILRGQKQAKPTEGRKGGGQKQEQRPPQNMPMTVHAAESELVSAPKGQGNGQPPKTP